MVYCLKGRLVCDTVTRRDNWRGALETRLATKPARWQADTIVSFDADPLYGGPGFWFRLWLTVAADADDLATRLQTLADRHTPQSGSYLAAYDATTDEDGRYGGDPFFYKLW